jgi:hypothetical protein
VHIITAGWHGAWNAEGTSQALTWSTAGQSLFQALLIPQYWVLDETQSIWLLEAPDHSSAWCGGWLFPFVRAVGGFSGCSLGPRDRYLHFGAVPGPELASQEACASQTHRLRTWTYNMSWAIFGVSSRNMQASFLLAV